MLRLSLDQMRRLDRMSEPSRNAALVDYARCRFGSHLKAATGDQLLEAVTESRRLASSWGVFAEPDVATILDLAILYGGGFGELEWAADILNCAEREGAEKIEALRARVRRTIPNF